MEEIDMNDVRRLLHEIGAAWLQDDFRSGVQAALKLGRVEETLISCGYQRSALAEAVQGRFAHPDANDPYPSAVFPQDLKIAEDWLMMVDRLALAVVGAKALGWEDMVRVLSEHLGHWAETVQREAKRLWMFASKAAERCKFFSGHASAWSVIRPAASYGHEVAVQLFCTNLLKVVMLWIEGELHPDDTTLLRCLLVEHLDAATPGVDNAIFGALVTLYRTIALGPLSKQEHPGHTLEVPLFDPALSLKDAPMPNDSFGPDTCLATVPCPHRGDGHRFEFHRCLEYGALTLVVMEVTPVMNYLATQVDLGCSLVILDDDIFRGNPINIIWREPTPLETLRALHYTLELLQPGHPLAGDLRTGAICLAAMKYFSEWEVLQPVYELSPRYPDSRDPPPDAETVDAWRAAATLFVKCYNLAQALIVALSDDDVRDEALDQATLGFLTGLRKPDVEGLCQAMGETWVAEHVTGKPFGAYCDIAPPAVGEKPR